MGAILEDEKNHSSPLSRGEEVKAMFIPPSVHESGQGVFADVLTTGPGVYEGNECTRTVLEGGYVCWKTNRDFAWERL